jgi:hypothetical protein
MILSTLSMILAAAEHAAEEPEKSELPFFIAGGVLASFAVIISVIGFKKPDFPATDGAAKGVMALGAMLVLAAMASIVYVAN